MSYTLGEIFNSPGGALNLARTAAAGTAAFNVSNANTNGIIGGWLTYNQVDWAAQSGANTAVAFAGYTPNTWGAGVNTDVTSSATLANATTSTLRFNAARWTPGIGRGKHLHRAHPGPGRNARGAREHCREFAYVRKSWEER